MGNSSRKPTRVNHTPAKKSSGCFNFRLFGRRKAGQYTRIVPIDSSVEMTERISSQAPSAKTTGPTLYSVGDGLMLLTKDQMDTLQLINLNLRKLHPELETKARHREMLFNSIQKTYATTPSLVSRADVCTLQRLNTQISNLDSRIERLTTAQNNLEEMGMAMANVHTVRSITEMSESTSTILRSTAGNTTAESLDEFNDLMEEVRDTQSVIDEIMTAHTDVGIGNNEFDPAKRAPSASTATLSVADILKETGQLITGTRTTPPVTVSASKANRVAAPAASTVPQKDSSTTQQSQTSRSATSSAKKKEVTTKKVAMPAS